MTRPKTAVHWMADSQTLVRGTLDPVAALGLAMDETSNGGWSWEDVIDLRPDRDLDGVPGAEHAHAIDAADFCFRRLNPANHRAGWFRINPCPPDHPEGWSWQLGYEKGPGRGNFQGVIFE